MRRFLIICISFVVLATLMPGALANTSFTVSPMTTELSLAPGEQHTQTLVVKDDDPVGIGTPNVPLHLKVYVMDWSLTRSGDPRFGDPGTIPGSCSPWVQVNPSEVTLLPGQTQTVRCTLTVPQGVQGTTHTMLMFEAAPQPMSGHSGLVAVSGRIGASLYVSTGPQARRARITALTVGPKKTVVTVENTGSALLRLQGTLTLLGADGKPAATTTVTPVAVLPGEDSIRDISIDTPTLPAGTSASTATILLDYGGDILLGARAPIPVR